MIETPLTHLLGLSAPIVQAGMAFAGMTPDLAIAVSNAGAMGSVAIGPMPVPVMEGLIAGIRAGTDRPFHVNFITIYAEDSHIEAWRFRKPSRSWTKPAPPTSRCRTRC